MFMPQNIQFNQCQLNIVVSCGYDICIVSFSYVPYDITVFDTILLGFDIVYVYYMNLHDIYRWSEAENACLFPRKTSFRMRK